MTGSFSLGRFFGFEIRIDYSWFIIFFLVLWTFSSAIFPQRTPGLGTAVYVGMGVAGAILFFVSVLLHELAHSAVARTRGIEIEGITLFIFGGMARTRMEAQTPKDEFLLTIVGPLSSVVIGFVLLALARFGAPRLPVAVTGVAEYLGFLNLLLAGFNMMPGFPLDGGRVFRSIVWYITGDLRKATRWASLAGRGFGFILIGLGVLWFFSQNVIGGIWFVFIGWFLAQAAESSYRQLIMRRMLEQVGAREAMTANPETVPSTLTLRQLVDEYFLRRRYNAFPVEDDGRLLGLITLSQVKEVDRARWEETRVGEVMIPVDRTPTVTPDQSLAEAVSRMEEMSAGRVLVVENSHLAGVITGSDISQWLQRYQQLK